MLFWWALGYAAYPAHYAAGGQRGMIGQPASDAQFRVVNAAGAGAGIVLLGALLPPVLVRVAWLRPAAPARACC